MSKPNLPIWEISLRSNISTSGSVITACSCCSTFLDILSWKSPKALESASCPFTRGIYVWGGKDTKPPDFSIRRVSSGSSGLWSFVANWMFIDYWKDLRLQILGNWQTFTKAAFSLSSRFGVFWASIKRVLESPVLKAITCWWVIITPVQVQPEVLLVLGSNKAIWIGSLCISVRSYAGNALSSTEMFYYVS